MPPPLRRRREECGKYVSCIEELRDRSRCERAAVGHTGWIDLDEQEGPLVRCPVERNQEARIAFEEPANRLDTTKVVGQREARSDEHMDLQCVGQRDLIRCERQQ